MIVAGRGGRPQGRRRRRLHELSIRYELACTLTHAGPVEEVIAEFLERLAWVVGAAVAVVFEDGAPDAAWLPRAQTGLGPSGRDRATLPAATRARVAPGGAAAVLDATELARLLPGSPRVHGALALLQAGSRPLGALLLARDDGRPFSGPTLALISEMAGRLAVRLDHARVHEELENAHLAAAVTQAGDAIEVTDLTGRVLFVNPAWERLTGWTRGDAIGRAVGGLLPLEEGTFPTGAQLTEGDAWTGQVAVRRRDGARLDLELTVTRVAGGPLAGPTVVTVRRDLTAALAAAAALRESEERYALATRGANDGIWDWKIDTGEVYFSARWREMLGWSEEEVAASVDGWLTLVHPEDLGPVRQAFRAHLDGSLPDLHVEHRMRHRDGRWLWVLCRGLAVRDASGRAVRMAGSQTDVSARKGTEGQLRYMAQHDGLTALPNRQVFGERLQACIDARRAEDGLSWAVMFIDLDRFKNVNDSLGHAIGDQLLVEVARRLRRCLRDGDVAARLGGDEFGVLLDGVDERDAVRVAIRIQGALARPIAADGHEIFSGASIGIAVGNPSYRAAGEALRDADIAMYTAKAEGRGRFHLFDAGLRARAQHLQRLESDLHHALAEEAFYLQFQPIIDLARRRVAGFEALLRWRHPERGLISPAEFIPVAEESGLIHAIWRQMLPRALGRAREWQRTAPGTYVSVNVSPSQFGEADLVGTVEREMERSGIEPVCLKVEITENALMRDFDRAADAMARLRERGIAVSLDDFGTGYSSLSILHRFPVQSLKIDRSFVSPLEDGPREAGSLVRSIIALAANLGIGEVVAEGVETGRQAALLSSYGCSHAQGFLFARPLDPDAAERLLRAGVDREALSAG